MRFHCKNKMAIYFAPDFETFVKKEKMFKAWF